MLVLRSSVADVEHARTIARPHRDIPVVAKIESAAGVANLAEICAAAGMVMAARGDLALTSPWPELPAAVNAIALLRDCVRRQRLRCGGKRPDHDHPLGPPTERIPDRQAVGRGLR
ncbi:pyruvate kinase [Actinocrispum sp. NPDC049592]|uniref:pyruvate kinase n=1 Tax=Actinocrispum sp. NPDC049592 TaxID=3154835 RepID=UPI003434CC4F